MRVQHVTWAASRRSALRCALYSRTSQSHSQCLLLTDRIAAGSSRGVDPAFQRSARHHRPSASPTSRALFPLVASSSLRSCPRSFGNLPDRGKRSIGEQHERLRTADGRTTQRPRRSGVLRCDTKYTGAIERCTRFRRGTPAGTIEATGHGSSSAHSRSPPLCNKFRVRAKAMHSLRWLSRMVRISALISAPSDASQSTSTTRTVVPDSKTFVARIHATSHTPRLPACGTLFMIRIAAATNNRSQESFRPWSIERGG